MVAVGDGGADDNGLASFAEKLAAACLPKRPLVLPDQSQRGRGCRATFARGCASDARQVRVRRASRFVSRWCCPLRKSVRFIHLSSKFQIFDEIWKYGCRVRLKFHTEFPHKISAPGERTAFRRLVRWRCALRQVPTTPHAPAELERCGRRKGQSCGANRSAKFHEHANVPSLKRV